MSNPKPKQRFTRTKIKGEKFPAHSKREPNREKIRKRVEEEIQKAVTSARSLTLPPNTGAATDPEVLSQARKEAQKSFKHQGKKLKPGVDGFGVPTVNQDEGVG